MRERPANRTAADRQLAAILSRVTYTGPEPTLPEDEVLGMVVEEVRALRKRQPDLHSQ